MKIEEARKGFRCQYGRCEMEIKAERISPEMVIEILNTQGMKVSLDEAKIILEFLRLVAGIVVENYLEKAS